MDLHTLEQTFFLRKGPLETPQLTSCKNLSSTQPFPAVTIGAPSQQQGMQIWSSFFGHWMPLLLHYFQLEHAAGHRASGSSWDMISKENAQVADFAARYLQVKVVSSDSIKLHVSCNLVLKLVCLAPKQLKCHQAESLQKQNKHNL